MSDLEQFNVAESSEVDQDAVERMRERMRESSAQIKKSAKDEKKQHKKELDLGHVIVKYLQSQQKREIMLLVIRCLEQNIAPIFILGIISLTEKEIRNQENIFNETENQDKKNSTDSQPIPLNIFTNALAKIGIEKETITAAHLQEFDNWIKTLLFTADEKAQNLLTNMRESDDSVKIVILQLSSFILKEFFASQKIDTDFKKMQAFSNFILGGIIKRLKKKEISDTSE